MLGMICLDQVGGFQSFCSALQAAGTLFAPAAVKVHIPGQRTWQLGKETVKH